ncbi:MAG TPA: hypothetical protein VIJ76_09290 [Galbitalea sp.]
MSARHTTDSNTHRGMEVGVRQIAPPLTREMLLPLTPDTGVVQFRTALSDRDYRQVGEWIRDYPDVLLRAEPVYDRSIMDLEFLRYFPTVKRFSLDASWFTLGSLDGLGYLSPDTDTLHIGRTRKRLSLSPLRRFSGLRRLYLDGATRDLDVLSELVALDSLTLRSVTLPDLRSLRSLTSLRALELKLGGITNLNGIGEVGDIRYLELSRIFGFHDLTPVHELSNLECLCLQSLPRIRRLPDLRRLPNLRELHLEEMPGLSEDELRSLPPGIQVGSGWSRPILTQDLTPSGIRVHAQDD